MALPRCITIAEEDNYRRGRGWDQVSRYAKRLSELRQVAQLLWCGGGESLEAVMHPTLGCSKFVRRPGRQRTRVIIPQSVSQHTDSAVYRCWLGHLFKNLN
jgi:hypothetical protein